MEGKGLNEEFLSKLNELNLLQVDQIQLINNHKTEIERYEQLLKEGMLNWKCFFQQLI